MKSLFIIIGIVACMVLMPVLVYAGTDQATASRPPLAQSLLREGTLATQLADVLKAGAATNEAEAESVLSRAGISPRNGWVADYPVTPDVVGELRDAIRGAADSKAIPMGKDEAMEAFEGVIGTYDLSVRSDTSGRAAGEQSAEIYPDSTVINNYYYDEGPPAVTYYAPPPDYAYLYSWVPYPFWWWNFWFPGFFVLADFNIGVHGHHGHDGRGGRGHHEFVSNHFRDPGTGRMSRIDPAGRSHRGTFGDRAGSRWSSPVAQRSAASIFNNSRSTAVSGNTRAFTPSRNSGRGGLPSGYGPTVSPSGRRNAVSGAATGATYSGSRWGRSSFNQPAYRQPSIGSRAFSSSSGGTRTFSAPLAGSRSSFGSGRSSFGGGGRSSFGSGGRSSFGGGSFGGARSSFGGGMRR